MADPVPLVLAAPDMLGALSAAVVPGDGAVDATGGEVVSLVVGEGEVEAVFPAVSVRMVPSPPRSQADSASAAAMAIIVKLMRLRVKFILSPPGAVNQKKKADK